MMNNSEHQKILDRVRTILPNTLWNVEVDKPPAIPDLEECNFTSLIPGTYLTIHITYYPERDTCHCCVSDLTPICPIWISALGQMPLEEGLAKLKEYLQEQANSLNRYLGN